MRTTDLLIFSFNRASQLHFLLESIFAHLPDFFNQISVLYKTSNQDFAIGYKKVREHFRDVNFVYEVGDFQTETLKLVSGADSDFFSFSTDDTVVYSSFPANIEYDYFLPDNRITVSSLRLGLNTTVQNHIDGMMQPSLNIYSTKGECLVWDSRLYHPMHNYGYPLSLDLHIFDREKILELMCRFGWQNSNQLEGGLQKFRNEIPYIKSLCESIAVNIPLNNISKFTKTNEVNQYSIEFLNQSYLSDKHLSLDSLRRVSIRGCHQDCELGFREVGSQIY